jgi:hypothetical protein
METAIRGEEIINLSKAEYDDMHDYMERLRETVDVLSDKKVVMKIC